ncbi:pumilio homolog 5-like [Cynara cardunculus var. scolymus]|uniref:pumilio homolog 5-like n=1 Tax=Cynara cardunculus var. scolymus TaxID=59895 RepID=UPI000D62F21F|nr:pumilio homolog 5-like [Cynara cardunculus var. scolymus]XP_024964543.1 pumilio homolog 5-like [Cynara cardunculus var. scolymus]
MATESPIRIIEASGKWLAKPSTNMGVEDLGLVLKGQRFQERKSNVAPNRSGSAPPSMEGSFAAFENLIFRQNFAADASLASGNNASDTCESEEQLRADPSYFAYYWTHVNLNPRLPPPLISGENRNLFRNVRSSGSNRKLTSFDDSFSSSFHLDHSNLATHKEESDDDRSSKQEDLPRVHSPAYNQSSPFKLESNEEADNHDDSNCTTANVSSSSSIDGRRANMSIKPPVNKNGHSDEDVSISGVADSDISGLRNRIVALNMSNISKLESERTQRERQQEHVYRQPRNAFHVQNYHPQNGMNSFLQNPTNFSSEVQPILQSSGFTPPPYATDAAYMPPGNHPVYPNMMPTGYFPQQYTIGGYAFNPSPFSPYAAGYLSNTPVPSFSGQSQTSGLNLQHFNNFYGHLGLPIQPLFSEEPKPQSLGAVGHINLNSRRVHNPSPYYFGSPTNMDFLQFPTSPFASPVMPGSPIGGAGYTGRRNEGVYGGWKIHTGNQVIDDPKTYSFLEELKTGKGCRLELLDISGHIVEFSIDQHGSRFIQQKLEVCSNEEKESVFKEVLPHASRLMIDVFGNYVIQKFFEYGSAEQRRELGNQLEGQILPLSLQMYGCRVIQKALDAIELEQKTKLVGELDGHVLQCVRDQNGNHVIQKCIESIPTEKIKFVISSFRGQVAALSKHPYGCRVIQRVLEHSTDELHSQFIVDEILDSVYDLAQDQYGNYVTQYVLEGGKPEERSQIVHKLAGHIVQLSQHKFASNVIEKCLEYSDPFAKEIMIEEIIGCADGSDNLLVMVKDQFANYVVQKVLQTCSGHQREVLLGRIKIHLNSLKKYTYGKHIVARFEQLYGEEFEASGL